MHCKSTVDPHDLQAFKIIYKLPYDIFGQGISSEGREKHPPLTTETRNLSMEKRASEIHNESPTS